MCIHCIAHVYALYSACAYTVLQLCKIRKDSLLLARRKVIISARADNRVKRPFRQGGHLRYLPQIRSEVSQEAH